MSAGTISQKVVYEQPLNERLRTFLRLEQLFHIIFYFFKDLSSSSSRQVMMAFIDVLEIGERCDIKSELMKELERLTINFDRLKSAPGVDQEKLSAILKRSEQLIQKMYAINGKIGSRILKDNLLAGVRQRSALTGGPCSFDLPAYHHWLQQPSELRSKTFSSWLSELEPVYAAATMVLKLVRESAVSQTVVAPQGFYQQTLNPQNPYQCIRVMLPAGSDYFPEISAGRHQFHIRFHTLSEEGEILHAQDKVSFEMACCVI